MEKWLLVVETDCKNPNREEDFNNWYDNEHIPDGLKAPINIVAIRRYERKNPEKEQAKYVAIWEIETDNIDMTLKSLANYRQSLVERGRMSELLQITERSVMKEMSVVVR